MICALSGGVDSSVAALLIHEAVGDQLTCILVDHGLMRKDEAQSVVEMFHRHYNRPLTLVDASDKFHFGARRRIRPVKEVQDRANLRSFRPYRFALRFCCQTRPPRIARSFEYDRAKPFLLCRPRAERTG